MNIQGFKCNQRKIVKICRPVQDTLPQNYVSTSIPAPALVKVQVHEKCDFRKYLTPLHCAVPSPLIFKAVFENANIILCSYGPCGMGLLLRIRKKRCYLSKWNSVKSNSAQCLGQCWRMNTYAGNSSIIQYDLQFGCDLYDEMTEYKIVLKQALIIAGAKA